MQATAHTIAAGTDLLITSVGALSDAKLRGELLAGPANLYLASGAIGGLDLLSAAARDDGLASLAIETTKAPTTVVQPWMSAAEREATLSATGDHVAFHGTVADAIERFPNSLNVAVAVAHATGMWQELTVTMLANPRAILTEHKISASGSSGDYEFLIRNRPHPQNSATSGIVPDSILSAIAGIAAPSGTFR